MWIAGYSCQCIDLWSPVSVVHFKIGIVSRIFYSDYLPSVEKSYRSAIVAGLDYFKAPNLPDGSIGGDRGLAH